MSLDGKKYMVDEITDTEEERYLKEKYENNNWFFNIPHCYDIDEIEYLNEDLDYMKSITDSNYKKIYPFIVNVLNKYEFEGCPIFIEIMDEDFIDRIVDEIVLEAKNSVSEVFSIIHENNPNLKFTKDLLLSFVRICVLNELFACRRPLYRRVLKNEFKK